MNEKRCELANETNEYFLTTYYIWHLKQDTTEHTKDSNIKDEHTKDPNTKHEDAGAVP